MISECYNHHFLSKKVEWVMTKLAVFEVFFKFEDSKEEFQ